MKITIEEKEYNYNGNFMIDQIGEILSTMKKHKNQGDNNICTISLEIEGELFFKEFKSLDYLADFLAGFTMGEASVLEKLDEYFEE